MKSRSAALPAPKNDEQALAYARRYAELDAAIAAKEAERTAAVAATNAAVDAIVLPQVAELGAIAKLMKPWWAVRGEALTGGKRKSIEFGGCHIGERTSTPKLKHPFKKDADAVEALIGTRWAKLFIRTTHSLDKRVLLKVISIGDKMAAAVLALGFSADQAGNFFIERLASEAVRADEVIA